MSDPSGQAVVTPATTAVIQAEAIPAAPLPATPAGTGQAAGTPPASPGAEDIDGTIAKLQADIKASQEQLEASKKRKAILDARAKDQMAVMNQRASSQLVLDDTQQSYAKWKAALEQSLTPQQRTDLENKIKAVDTELTQAEQDVGTWQAKFASDETNLAAATSRLAMLEASYAAKQKLLNQLPARMKDMQARIEKLRAEVKSFLDARDWSHAYYKNYRLAALLAQAGELLDPTKEEAAILAETQALETQLEQARTTLATTKTSLEANKARLKAADDELKRKQAGLETAIDAFL